jgi:hypothetical protein
MAWATPTGLITYASSSLNSLGNGVWLSATNSSTISNDVNLYQYMNLELKLGPLTPTNGGYADIWLYSSIDNGTSFASDTGSLLISNLFHTFPLATQSSTSQCVVAYNKPIPPLAFKLAVRNGSGVQFSGTGASANSLRYTMHNEA